MRKAIYPGTFDPITLGHTDLARRALGLFDELTVAVAADSTKPTVFPIAERTAMAQDAFAGLSDALTIVSFEGLLVDFARTQGASVIIRGLRAVSDFEYEFQLASMNRQLAPDIESVFLTPASEYAFLSSSLVREVAQLGGDISLFVPDAIVDTVRGRLSRT